MSKQFFHMRFGLCELVRVEGVDWIVRALTTQLVYRVPPSRRIDFKLVADSSDDVAIEEPTINGSSSAMNTSDAFSSDGVRRLLSAIRPPTKSVSRRGPVNDREVDPLKGQPPLPTSDGHARENRQSNRTASPNPPEKLVSEGLQTVDSQTPQNDQKVPIHFGLSQEFPTDQRRLRRIFESLRNGLSPIQTELRPFAVGVDVIQQKATHLLDDVMNEGGRTVVFRGGYGHGKTFCLQLLRQMALDAGFAVMSSEINAYETPLDKPHRVYHSLMQSLSFPDDSDGGALGLALKTRKEILSRLGSGTSGHFYSLAANRILLSELQCKPLAWILSDPNLPEKSDLLGLLASEPGASVSKGRRTHMTPASTGDWPSFNAGTQGDFASYLLSGIGRLTRFLRFNGLILILDEMEKWQDLNWQAQTRAGNLLGGLIWGSSAEEGSRWCWTDRLDSRWRDDGDCDHVDILEHSRRCGGYPFTTAKRCSLGLAIAMTPRGDEGPEATWSNYGLLEIVDLPAFSREHLHAYMRRIFPAYLAAYALTGELTSEMLNQAVAAWYGRGDVSTRTAIQATLSVLDAWKDTQSPTPIGEVHDRR